MGNGRWNSEETEALCSGVERWGKRWSRIIQDPVFATKLRGRSDGDCKDRWRTLEKAKESCLAERSRISLERAAERSPSPPRLRRAKHRELIKTLKKEIAERDHIERGLRLKLAKTSASLVALEALHSSCPKLIQSFSSQASAAGVGKSRRQRSDQAEYLVGWLSSLEAIAGMLPTVDLALDEARCFAAEKMRDLTATWLKSNSQWTAPLAILEKLEATMNHVAQVAWAFEHLKLSNVDARLSRKTYHKRPWRSSVAPLVNVPGNLETLEHKRRVTVLTGETRVLSGELVTLPRLDPFPDMIQLADASQSLPTNALAPSSSSKRSLPPDNVGELTVSAYLSKLPNWRSNSSDSADVANAAIEEPPNIKVESSATDVSTCVHESADTCEASQDALENLSDPYSPVHFGPKKSARRACPDLDSLAAAQSSLQMLSSVDSQLSAPDRDLSSLSSSGSYPLDDDVTVPCDVPMLFSDGFVDFDDFDCEDICYGSV